MEWPIVALIIAFQINATFVYYMHIQAKSKQIPEQTNQELEQTVNKLMQQVSYLSARVGFSDDWKEG